MSTPKWAVEQAHASVEPVIALLKSLQAAEDRAWTGDPEDRTSVDRDTDDLAREVCRRILREVGVYDAHGCPLCLS